MDDKIKKKLEDLSPEFNPEHWEAMSSRLDASVDAEMDAAIRSKLDAVESTVPAAGFESFEAFRDQSEQSWDNEVKSKLDDINITGSPQWALFTQKLDAFKKMRRDYFGFRIAEIVLILLLFWTVHQYDHLWKANPSSVASKSEQVITSSSKSLQDLDIKAVERSQPTDSKNPSTSSKIEGASNEELLSSPSNQNEVSKSTTSTINNGSNSNSTPTSVSANKASSKKKALKTPVPGQELTSLTYTGGNKDASKNRSVISGPNSENNAQKEAKKLTPSRWGLLPPLLSATPQLNYASPAMSSTLPPIYLGNNRVQEGGRAPIWLSLMVNGGINQITTPSTDTFSRSVDHTPSLGVSLLVEFEHGRWFLGSGLEYHTTDIRPNRSVLYGNAIDGFALVTYESAKLDFFSLPILVRYNFIDDRRNVWFANAGVRLHASSKIKYDFTINNDFPNQANLDEIDAYNIHGVSETHFNYFTLNLGLGYQRAVTSNMSAFMSTGVELFGQTNSLFPSQEVINVLRADLGLRYRL